MNAIQYILYLFFAMIIHEIGHILIMYIYNKKIPKISFSNGSIVVGETKDIINLSIIQYMNLLLSGVFSGYLYLMMVSDNKLLFALYFIACAMDVQNVIVTITELVKNKLSFNTKIYNVFISLYKRELYSYEEAKSELFK